MANGFAIDIGNEGAAYEQGVNMPNYSSSAAAVEGLTSLGQGVFGILDAMDAAKKAAAPTQAEIDKQSFGNLSKGVDNLKGMNPLQQRTGLTTLLTSYLNAGNEIGEAEARMIKMKVGLDVDSLRMDPQKAAIQENLDKILSNPSALYNAREALVKEGKPFTEEQVVNKAYQTLIQVEAATLYISNAKTIDKKQYYDSFLPHAESIFDDLVNRASYFMEVEIEGGNINPESLSQLRGAYEKARANFTRPPSVSAEEYSTIQNRIDAMDRILTAIQNYDQNTLDKMKADRIRVNTLTIMKMAKEIGLDPVTENALLSDKLDLSVALGPYLPEILKTLSEARVEDLTYTDLNTVESSEVSTVNQEEGQPVPTPKVDNLHTIEEVEKAEERSDGQRKDAIFFSVIQRISNVTPKSMEQPELRENFFTGIGQATVNISTSPKLFKNETMTQIYNDETYKKIEAAMRLDPDKAKIAKDRLIDGLLAQFNIASTAISGSSQSSFFTLSGLGEVEYDLEKRVDTGQIRMDKKVLPLVKGFASKYYNGNVTEMIADRAVRLDTFERTQIENVGFNLRVAFQDYRKIFKNSESLRFYVNNMKKLGVSTEEIESMLIKPVQAGASAASGTLQNPWQIVWSDETDADEILFASIGRGEYYTDINGDVRIKN